MLHRHKCQFKSKQTENQHPHHTSVESWKLSAIKRDDYAPNTGGQKLWDADRKRWLAGRLTEIMKVRVLLFRWGV